MSTDHSGQSAIATDALQPITRLNRGSGAYEVVPGLFEVSGRTDVLVVRTPDGRYWRCRRSCPHRQADLALTGKLGPGHRTIVCSRHKDQGPFDFAELDAVPLDHQSGWLSPAAGDVPATYGREDAHEW